MYTFLFTTDHLETLGVRPIPYVKYLLDHWSFKNVWSNKIKR